MLTEYFFLVFSGAALLAIVAMYTRQPLLVAYILLGALIGPFGLELIHDIDLLNQAAEIGIIFLLFLLGLDMHPRALISVLKKVTRVTLLSSVAFSLLGFGFALAFGFNTTEAILVGVAMMFSSTIIAIKLLPTTVLHHKHSGDMMIGLLLMQDFLAIIVLTILLTADASGLNWIALGKALIALPILAGFAYAMTRFFLLPILAKFDRIQEFMFLIAIGWCLGIAEMAAFLGLSLEIGAFIAGIALATSPIAQHIALSLKPLRDFFLIVFFFAIGAGFNVGLLPTIWLPALLLAALMLGAKPVIYRFLMARQSESRKLAWDLGFRLGQLSEFSLLIVFLAVESQLMGERASVLVQAATIVSLIVSSYVVIFNFPNPLAVSDRLRRD